tara:strand:- start:613 stop:792 length:180 start_codon:yes stop_codon:yes gene_type:complete
MIKTLKDLVKELKRFNDHNELIRQGSYVVPSQIEKCVCTNVTRTGDFTNAICDICNKPI